MNKSNKKVGILFFLLTFLVSIGGAFLLTNIQLSQNNKFVVYKEELLFSFIFGIIISFPDFFAEIKKTGTLFFNFNRFIIFAIPCIILNIVEFSLMNGSMFFSKIVTYFLVAMLSYSILSSFKRK